MTLLKTKITQSSGLQFEGINDELQYPYVADLDLDKNSPFSICTTFKNNINSLSTIMGNWNYVNKGWLIFAINSGYSFVLVSDYAGGDVFEAAVYPPPAEYNEVVNMFISYDGVNEFTIRVNDLQYLFNYTLVGSTTTTNPFIISHNFTGFPLDGDVYVFKKYNRQLNPTERDNTRLGIYPDDFVFNLPFNEKEGFLVKDSVNGIVGTIINKTVGDVTIGANNSWLYRNGLPFDGQQHNLITSKSSKSAGLEFDGVDDVVDLPVGTTPFNFTYTDDFSISMFVKVNDFTNLNGFITNRGTPIFYLAGVFSDGRVFLITEYLSGEIYATNNSYFTELSNGCHIVLTRTGNGVGGAIYINGDLVSIGFANLGVRAVDNVSGYHSIGSNFGTDLFNGSMFDFKIFNKVLNQAEVSEIVKFDGNIVPTTAQANLLVDYRFNNNQGFIATDSSGNNINGNLTNYSLSDVTIGNTNSWLYRNGLPFNNLQIIGTNQNWSIGDGLKFDGVNDYVSLGNSNAFALQTDYSISFIINTFAIPNIIFPLGTIIGRSKIGTAIRDWIIFVIGDGVTNNYGIFFQSTDNTGTVFPTIVTLQVLQYNKVYHCFIVVDSVKNVTIKVYDFDGLVTQTTGSLPIYVYDNIGRETDVGVTRQNGGDAFYFNGINYDTKIFNKALTQSEIEELHLKRGQTLPSTAINNLVANYPFNQRQGFILTDTSGNGFNGSLINYTAGDTTVGVNNSWLNQYGNPITQL